MTAVILETSPTAAPSRGPRGLLWAMLRLHRSALWFWGLLVAVAAGALLWAYGPGADAAWAEYREMGCGSSEGGLSCDYTGPAYQRYDMAVGVGAGLLGLVPLLVGAWAGGALIGRELESGTAQWAWTQSVSPARWLAAKLAVPAALIATGTLTLTLLHRVLWSTDGPLRVAMFSREWHDDLSFVANGILATAYPLLGLAVGALAGLVLRRALPALGAAVVGLAALMYVLASLRPRLWPVETVTNKEGYESVPGMLAEYGNLTVGGDRIADPNCYEDSKCGAEHDVVGYYVDFHPSSHFWPLQLMETGIVLAVAALAVLIAFALLRRRTGAAV